MTRNLRHPLVRAFRRSLLILATLALGFGPQISPNPAIGQTVAQSDDQAQSESQPEVDADTDTPADEPTDQRRQPPKDLNGDFTFDVPADLQAWEQRAEQLKRQIRVATGLWPWPAKTPLNPVVHGLVERDDFTVEKVYFESIPGHFVSGLLFRPRGPVPPGGRPAVLSPHGHGGRLQDHGAEKIKQLIAEGQEQFEQSGRVPKLARCVHLARMGCVCFIFDMLGYADSQQVSMHLAHRFREQRPELDTPHRWGLYSAQAEMRMQSIMGVQTWNSVRCLDFLQQLPDVDPKRLAVTGGSGGGTQTILLCAIDDRPIAAFPNGMVSVDMQGGCTCENCSLLRVETGNVELAALFAPKPQAMTCVNDWTRRMMENGYPQLQQVYEYYNARPAVACYPMLQFPHNYNHPTRRYMYAWFNQHMKLGLDEAALQERDFALFSAEETAVWNEEHPQPEGGPAYEFALTQQLARQAEQQLSHHWPVDKPSQQQFRQVIGQAWQTLIGRSVPPRGAVTRTELSKTRHENILVMKDRLTLSPQQEDVLVTSLWPTSPGWNQRVFLWLDDASVVTAGQPETLPAEVRRLLEQGTAVAFCELFQQSDQATGGADWQQPVVDNPRQVPAYTYCYNTSTFTRRVHDVLSVIRFVLDNDERDPAMRQIDLVARGEMAAVGAAARAIAGDAIDHAIIDSQGFRFANVRGYRSANFQPGAVKYGDLPALLALSAPHALTVVGEDNMPVVQRAYRIDDEAAFQTSPDLTTALKR